MIGISDPALRLLARRKLRAAARKQVRRLRNPKDALLGLLGVAVFTLWIASLVVSAALSDRPAADPAEVLPLLRGGGLVMLVLTLAGSLNHRGLFLPSEEIERLFSAPLARGDVVRYRLLVGLGRSVFGGLVLGILFMARMPVPGFALAGVFAAIAATVAVGQVSSLLAGAIERRVFQRLLRLPGRALFVLAVVAGAALLVYGMSAEERGAEGVDSLFGGGLPGREELVALLDTGWVRALALPVEPFARTIGAATWGDFATWFPATLLLVLALVELTARLPLDYRELSLETSANVSERLRRMRRVGAGAAGSRVSLGTRGLRVPFLFGRGPAGAVAWRKATEIVRKARGTIWVSALVLAVLLVFAGVLGRAGDASALQQGLLVAGLGTVYLCSGLRFDFRDDLDRMATIKAWPLTPARAFLAMLLPESLLVSTLLGLAVLLRLGLTGELPLEALALLAALPLVVFGWVALDNAVFLVAPVRYVPGQDGALQNAGRLALLVAVRTALTAVAGAAVLLAGLGVHAALARGWAWEPRAARLGAFAAAWCVLLAVDALLVACGGWAFARFDVARDRG